MIGKSKIDKYGVSISILGLELAGHRSADGSYETGKSYFTLFCRVARTYIDSSMDIKTVSSAMRKVEM